MAVGASPNVTCEPSYETDHISFRPPPHLAEELNTIVFNQLRQALCPNLAAEFSSYYNELMQDIPSRNRFASALISVIPNMLNIFDQKG